MASNDYIIESLRQGFEIDKDDRYTNCALLFAYNGTGKTRLSYDFAHYDRGEDAPQHTLYYNAYTEDLFTWDNDLENNTDHHLLINQSAALIQGLAGYNFTEPLRKYLNVFTDIDFDFHYAEDNPDLPDYVVFNKKTVNDELIENIKVSRGEERLFVWCFFRCILDQVVGGNDAYKDIEYIYIDDPMSSLDDNNVIAFASQLYKVIRDSRKQEDNARRAGKEDYRRIKFVVSSHHALFFHVMLHGLMEDAKLGRYYLHRDKDSDELVLKSMSDKVPFFYNVAMMCEIQDAIDNDRLYTYHFNIMRSVMEKIREFFGHQDLSIILDGITYKGNTFDETAFSQGDLVDLYARIVNVFSHEAQFFSPTPMNEDNKDLMKTLFKHLKKKYRFRLPDLHDERSEKEIQRDNRRRANRRFVG